MRLSHNFTLAELEHSQVIKHLERLCQEVLQPIRDHFGAVHISSGYRCPALNKHIGGSPRSQHCQSEAADIVIANVKPIEVCRWVVATGLPFDQLIEEGNLDAYQL